MVALSAGEIRVRLKPDTTGAFREGFGDRSLSLIHGAHRLRYTLYDVLQIKHLNEVINAACYGGAIATSIWAAYLLWDVASPQ